MDKPGKRQDDSIIHVAVAVIVRNNRVLIARRPAHVHQGDRWEFPGGKVEPGEMVKQALRREINEELGIEITHSEPLISVLHHYEDKSVLLDTWKVNGFRGREYAFNSPATGLENQTVQWVDIDTLKHYTFPAANKPIISAIQLPDTYLITPDTDNVRQFLIELENTLHPQHLSRTVAHEHSTAQLQTRPPVLLQLRIGSLQGKALGALIIQVCEWAQDMKARTVSARVMLNAAMLTGSGLNAVARKKILTLSSGLHLPARSLSDHALIHAYRHEFPHKLLSASCHDHHEIELANRHQVDFIVLSPVQTTSSHPTAVPLGWEKFARLVKYSRVPAYALGGLGSQDIVRAKVSGAQGIAAISALWNVK